MNFVSHAKLLDQPDPRRLDLRASISSIQKDWLVRVNQQRASITVSAIIDVSASMHFGAQHKKLHVAAQFLQALGFSAGGLGDTVSLQAFDTIQREDLTMPARPGRGLGQTMASLIQDSIPSSPGHASMEALSRCIESVAARADLVFIVSDFHWPLDTLEQLLDPLAGSMVVPLVIWDNAEVRPPQGKHLLSAVQLGGRRTRQLWLTPAIRKQWISNVESRRNAIAAAFAGRDVKPFLMTDGFDPEALSRYFMEAGV